MTTRATRIVPTVLLSGMLAMPAMAEGIKGYYRQPTIRGESIVFVAEGDLWKVNVAGGLAARLTTHPGDETGPVISPDGTMIAFTAMYEGPGEVYTMPLDGGLPTRRTYEGGGAVALGWTPEGKLIYTTRSYSTSLDRQLVTIDVATGDREVQPLAQASDGCFDEAGTLYFVRLPFQGSQTKRYQGGTAQNLWKYPKEAKEATALTADFDGTSKRPMWWKGRVYFLTDRDGTMNLWSMDRNGGDLKQHTRYAGWELRGADLQGGQVVYQVGADIHVYDIATDADRLVEITLASDMDQTREAWVTSPMDYLTSAHVSPDGDRVALTARGEVFVAPTGQGRLVRVTRNDLVRYRDAKFMPDGQSLYAMSDESGEVEFWTLPTNGIGATKQVTKDGTILRWEGVASPDGKKIAHHDKNQKLWICDVETGVNTQIDEIPYSGWDQFMGLRWSSDSRWLAYVTVAPNTFRVIKVYDAKNGTAQVVTSTRYESYDPAWSADGKWLYFLSDRHMESWVGSPWGARAPQPFFPETTKIYMVSLKKGERSPFDPDDEVQAAKKKAEEKKKEEEAKAKEGEAKSEETAAPEADAKEGEADAEKKDEEQGIEIDFEGIQERVLEVPVGAGSYGGLYVTENQVFWGAADVRPGGSRSVMTLTIKNRDVEAKTFAGGIGGWEVSGDGKKMLIQKDGGIFVVDASGDSAGFDKAKVNLSGWTINFTPREQWKQIFREAWRLERDYFYDPGMHGVDWNGMLTKYEPLVDRVSTRGELSDLIAQMVSELSALHIFVFGGDARSGDDNVGVATLGANMARDEGNGGWRVEHIYRTDPDRPEERSPLAKPGLDVAEGDVITMINGESTRTHEPSVLLRNQAGKQVLLHVKTPATGAERDVIVTPIPTWADGGLRYSEWEYTRRLQVEDAGKGEIGYVHLRAMGQADIEQWTREFFPVFDRKGLIIDVRSNNGGNIDSWILTQLLRKRWSYWHGRLGESTWNMQYAFGGHVVVLIDGQSSSDGEAFPEGFRRLGLGKLIGKRTWGGGIWLSSSNFLRDGGIATAAEFGVYGPEGKWIIEGRGIDPDIEVDNLPHETFVGKDAQLEAAIAHLQELIRTQPMDPIKAPEWLDKSSPDNAEKK